MSEGPPPSEKPGPEEFLSPDEAIHTSGEDELGRAKFASDIADAIASWKNSSSLVFAIVGPWGSGKTSVKNLALEALERKAAPSRPAVLHFIPWEWAGQGRIISGFFEELAALLGATDKSDAGQERAEKLLAYGQLLQGAGTSIGGLPVAMTGVVGAGIALGGSFLTGGTAKTVLSWVALILLLLSLLVGVWGQSLTTIGQLMKLRMPKRTETLPERKKQLATLMEIGIPVPPVLVVMDDLDRLDQEELLQVIQLIRANADLPNLVYLLLYEEEVVSRTLDQVYQAHGREAMEKIVNIPLVIPAVSATDLQEYGKKKVQELVKKNHLEIDELRWDNIVADGWGALLKNLRTVKRFLNIYALHLRMAVIGGKLEVDAGDLAAVDLLRVGEPRVYEALTRAKDWLTRDTRAELRDARKQSFEELLALASEEHRSAVERLLRRLFPPIESFMGSLFGSATFHSDGQFLEWWLARRVCSHLAFDTYFSLTPPRVEATGAQVRSLADATENEEALLKRLRELCNSGVAKSALTQLQADQVPVERLPVFLRGLFRAADDFLYTETRLPGLPPDEGAAIWAIRRLARERLEEPDYIRALICAIQATEAVYLPAMLLSWEVSPQSPVGSLQDASVSTLREACLATIRKAAMGDKLLHTPSLAYVLYRWREYGDPQEVKNWLQARVNTVQDVAEYAVRMGGYHTAGPFQDQVHRASFEPALGDLTNLIGRDYLIEISAKFGNEHGDEARPDEQTSAPPDDPAH